MRSISLPNNEVVALVDCNNFFASCERVFRPDLIGKPIVVLSNNDGCVVARSNEAKALGIGMGVPYFKVKDLCESKGVKVFSSNYQLYGDFSDRVMQSLRMLAPEIEVYSIDEAFLNLNGLDDPVSFAKHIRACIFKWTGIYVSIGIARNKTLAKVANFYAKKSNGVFSLLDADERVNALRDFPIEEIWGIGRNLAIKLRMMGVGTAYELAQLDTKAARKLFAVVGERLVRELQGEKCLSLDVIRPKKSIVSSRSFGKLISSIDDVTEAVADHAAKVAYKLRKQNSRASGLYVFIKTNRYRVNETYYSNGKFIGFCYPVNDSRVIIKAAVMGLYEIFKSGLLYKKVGVMLVDLSPDGHQQQDLFVNYNNSKGDKLMKALDSLAGKIGRNKVAFAAQGIKRTWVMKCDLRSPRYTTCLKELPVIF